MNSPPPPSDGRTFPDRPTIQIMMPYYGDPELFRLAVISVRDQSDPNWQLVVIDDLYPDTAPGRWLTSLGDKRITYIRNAVNLGVSGNFSKAVEMAACEFTVIMGCDDLLLPDYVASVSDLVREFPEASYVQVGVEVIDGQGGLTTPLADRVKGFYRPRTARSIALAGEPLARSLLKGNWTYFPSICWRTSVLKAHGFRADLEVVLDLALQIEIILAGGVMVLDRKPIFQYRRHNASVSSWMAQDGTRFQEEQAYFLSTARLLRDHGWPRAACAARFHVSSRLNAASKIPAALHARDHGGIRSLSKHIFGL